MKSELPSARPRPVPDTQRSKIDLWCSLLLLAGVLVVFFPALRAGFINFDDDLYVTANQHVQSGLTWSGVAWAFGSAEATNWHPLTWLSHMLDYQIYGPAAWGHHLTSVLLHGANAVLLFFFIRRLTGARWPSLFVAALFALHPLRVESVAWVAERKDVLSAFFFLLTLIAYAGYARCRPLVKPHRSPHFFLALLFFVLGLMSKPMLVTLPFVLLLLDYWPLQSRPGVSPGPTDHRFLRLLLEKIPFFLLALTSSCVTFIVQKSGGAVAAPTALPFAVRLANAAVAYTRYLGKTLWPHDLSMFYPYPPHWPSGLVLGSCALLLVVSFLVVAFRHRAPYGVTGWFWFVGMLVPVIGLVQAGQQSMADRYTYLPSVGLFVLIVWAVYGLFGVPLSHPSSRPLSKSVSQPFNRSLEGGQPFDKGRDKDFDKGLRPRMALSAGFTLAILAIVPLTWIQAGRWRDDDTLFGHALAVREDNHVAHDRLGVSLMRRGRVSEALEHFEEAVRIKPHDADLRGDLANALCRSGRVDAGIRQYQEAIRLRPDAFEAHYNLGIALCNSQRLDDGLAEFETAAKLAPRSARVRRALGVALAAKGRREEAIRELKNALALQPDYPEAERQLKALQR